jgi:hypothetical protein
MPKLAFDEIVGRDRNGRALLHPAALAMDAASRRRRLGRDEGETLSSQESELWFDLLAQLPEDERNELYAEFKARLGGEDPADVTGDRRRRARDEDPDHNRLNGYGMPDPNAADRRRARDRRPVAADSKGLPTFEDLFPGAAARLRG